MAALLFVESSETAVPFLEDTRRNSSMTGSFAVSPLFRLAFVPAQIVNDFKSVDFQSSERDEVLVELNLCPDSYR